MGVCVCGWVGGDRLYLNGATFLNSRARAHTHTHTHVQDAVCGCSFLITHMDGTALLILHCTVATVDQYSTDCSGAQSAVVRAPCALACISNSLVHSARSLQLAFATGRKLLVQADPGEPISGEQMGLCWIY